MTNTTEIPAEIIADALDCVRSSISVRNDYPGRAMYGEGCFAIVVDDAGTVAEFMWALASQVTRLEIEADEAGRTLEFDPWELQRMASNSSQDSMGMGLVVYFPGYVLDGECGYEDED